MRRNCHRRGGRRSKSLRPSPRWKRLPSENDYNLNISRYVDSTEPPPQLDVKGELRKLRDLERTRNEAEQRMNTLLEEVGYAL